MAVSCPAADGLGSGGLHERWCIEIQQDYGFKLEVERYLIYVIIFKCMEAL